MKLVDLLRQTLPRSRRPWTPASSGSWKRLLKFRLRTAFQHPGIRRAPLRTLVRFLTLRALLWRHQPITVELHRWGARLVLPPDWGSVGIGMIYCLREDYEPELIAMERFVAPGQVVVDAGASCGIYTVAFAKLLAGTGRVLAFEPGARAYAVLDQNIRLNGLTNARAFRLALADRAAQARLRHHAFGPVSYFLDMAGEADKGEDEKVATGTLDDVLRSEGTEHVDVLKMDVEGAEELVLRGARAALARSRPVILFEHDPGLPKRLGLSPNGVTQMLGALGYRLYRVTPSGDLRMARPIGEIGNFIALPKEPHAQ